MRMLPPDFATTDARALAQGDLRFLLERLPQPVSDPAGVARLLRELPSTLESMLESDYLFDSLMQKSAGWIEVSPFLLFNVLLRHSLEGRRSAADRRVINYLANLLSLFLHSERLHRVQRGEAATFEYLVDLVAEAARSDAGRQFLVHSHIGNYALYLAGLRAGWIEHRHRYRRRPLDLGYYRDMGRAHFHQAARHPLAREYGLADVFGQLAARFEEYRGALHRLSERYLAA